MVREQIIEMRFQPPLEHRKHMHKYCWSPAEEPQTRHWENRRRGSGDTRVKATNIYSAAATCQPVLWVRNNRNKRHTHTHTLVKELTPGWGGEDEPQKKKKYILCGWYLKPQIRLKTERWKYKVCIRWQLSAIEEKKVLGKWIRENGAGGLGKASPRMSELTDDWRKRSQNRAKAAHTRSSLNAPKEPHQAGLGKSKGNRAGGLAG